MHDLSLKCSGRISVQIQCIRCYTIFFLVQIFLLVVRFCNWWGHISLPFSLPLSSVSLGCFFFLFFSSRMRCWKHWIDSFFLFLSVPIYVSFSIHTCYLYLDHIRVDQIDHSHFSNFSSNWADILYDVSLCIQPKYTFYVHINKYINIE